ncbi:urease accessory protein UreF [Actinospongicola halichondriae]|uniref:urease accessory protein UreF n=1 Tax=Actinospongicola halichondriae TaxID=3236844 RepID=UPI003D5423B8
MSLTSLLLLADGRFPDGTYAHSHGLETAVDAGRVHDAASLAEYVTCRLWTSGRTDAAAARLAAAGVDPDELDAAWGVRTPSAKVRATSRSLGRSLARTAAVMVPDGRIVLADGRPPVQPVAFGLLASAIGCDPDETALASAHGTAATLSAAGLRLLSLDPFDVTATLYDLRPEVDGVAASTIGLVGADDLPHASTPFAEIDVELQSALPTRLFRS